MRRWEEEEYYRRIAEEERFWEEENRRRFEAEFFEGWGPARMGPPRGPPGLLGPRPLMEGVGDMGPVKFLLEYYQGLHFSSAVNLNLLLACTSPLDVVPDTISSLLDSF